MYISYSLDPEISFRILKGLVKEQLSNDIQMLLEWKSCELVEINIQIDHIHLIVSILPQIAESISKKLNQINTS